MAIVDSYAKLPDGNKACKPTGNRGGATLIVTWSLHIHLELELHPN